MSDFANIRELIGGVIGQVLVDISQHDESEWAEDGVSYVELLFSQGHSLRFYMVDEKHYHPAPGAIRYSFPSDDGEEDDDDDETALADVS